MSWPDTVNGTFEAIGGIIGFLNCLKLYKDKRVQGVVWQLNLFYMLWGFWNLWYYPSLKQILSFYGGLSIVITNTIWVGMVIYYRRKERKAGKEV